MMWILHNGCKDKDIPGFIFVSSIIFDLSNDGKAGKIRAKKMGAE